jgi:hypothetical protein
MGTILIPFAIMLVAAWFTRKWLLWNGERIPRGIIIIFLALGLVPIVNVLMLIVGLGLLVWYSIGDGIKITFRETRFTKYLKE